MAKKAKRRDVLAEFADAMTPEQYIAFLQSFDPLTDEERAISDDDLLAALNA